METCPRCGATLATGQEYCLECGQRLERPDPLAATAARREWLWPVFVGLLIAATMTGVAIAVARGGDPNDRPHFVATTETGIAVGPTVPTEIPPEPTTTAETTTEETVTETEAPTPRVIEWPEGQSGYTVVLASLPVAGGRRLAIAKGNEALRKGLDDVGVLESSKYPRLNPGYYVVFTGVYSSEAEARRGRARAVAAGYGIAYVRQVGR